MSNPRASQAKPDPKHDDKAKQAVLLKPVKSVVPKLAKAEQGKVKLNLLRLALSQELGQMLDKIPGNKTLVLDPSLIGPLALVAPFSFLQSKQVDPVVRKIDGVPFESTCHHLVFLARPRMDIMKHIAKQIQQYKPGDKTIHLFLVPRRTLICEIVLERAGVYGLIEKPIGEYAMDLIPFDNDLLSMEIGYGFRETNMEGDKSVAYYCARALMKIQSLYGYIPKMRYIGKEAETVYSMVTDFRKRIVDQGPTTKDIDELIIFDRSVDPFTPLCTQLTYEGLIDELYGIHNNLLSLDFLKDFTTKPPPAVQPQQGDQPANQPPNAQPPQQPQAPKKPKKMALNDDDMTFAKIRHEHFLCVGTELAKITKEIEEIYAKRSALTEVKEIKEFFKSLPFLQQRHEDLTTHVNIATEIKKETVKTDFKRIIEAEQNILSSQNEKEVMDLIEEMIIKQDPLPKVLRLICLLCLVKNGYTPKDFDFLRKELVHSYGHFVILTLHNLEEAGLFFKIGTRKSKIISWPRITTPFGLFDDKIKEHEPPVSIHYVHSGYAPLSVRLVELARELDGWTKVKTHLERDGIPVGEVVVDKRTDIPIGTGSENNNKVVMVVFVGGCTFAEISALRFLRKHQPSYRYIVATTKLINGNSLLSSLFESLQTNPSPSQATTTNV